jgi:putative ABC transport system permease protein
VISELRFAARRLRAAPAFAFGAILTIGLAIGANASVFSMVRGLLDHPLPLADAERVAWVYARTNADPNAREKLGGDEVTSLVRDAASLEAVAVIGDRGFVRVEASERSRWGGIWVTPGIALVLGVAPALGRMIAAEDVGTSGRVMMIGYSRWMRDFGGDSSIIGRAIHFDDNHVFTVIGVLPRGLEFPFARQPQSGNGSGFAIGEQDFWIPGHEAGGLPGGAVVVRVRRGVAMATARAEVATIASRFAADSSSGPGREFELVSVRDQALGLVRPGLRLAQAFAVLMLILACANLTNLVLVRASERERELAIRVTLGASALAIARRVVAEVAIVVAVGAALGLVLAAFARDVLRLLAAQSVILIEHVVIDWTVVLFTGLVSILVTVVVALLGSLAPMRGQMHALVLGPGRSQTAGRGHARLRATLVASQVALAVILCVGATLVARSFVRLASVDAGYDPTGVISVDVALDGHPNAAEFYRDLKRRLEALPGVEAVGLIQSTPLTGKWTFRDPFEIVGRSYGREGAPAVWGSFVAFDYFRAMRIPLIAGRVFTEAESLNGNAPVVVINESAARRFFPGRSPLGEAAMLAGAPRRIVGVVKDTRDRRLDAPTEPQWYQPLLFAGTEMMIRVASDPAASVPMIRRELAADSRLTVARVDVFEDIVAGTIIERRMAMRLLATLAALALGMAAVGLYGVLSYAVAQRRRELGVRSALGADRLSLIALVLQEGVGLALIGVAIGVAFSLPATSVLRRLLFEISPTDPVSIAGIAMLLMVVAAVASAIPAWRAAAVHPATTLRSE